MTRSKTNQLGRIRHCTNRLEAIIAEMANGTTNMGRACVDLASEIPELRECVNEIAAREREHRQASDGLPNRNRKPAPAGDRLEQPTGGRFRISDPNVLSVDTWQPRVGDTCHKYVNGDRYAHTVVWVSQAGNTVQARRCDVFTLDADSGQYCFQDDPYGEMVMFSRRHKQVDGGDGLETITRWIERGGRWNNGISLRPGWDEYRSREV